MTDVARATLVTHPFRYATVEDASIKARNPQAIEIEIDTNLDSAGGAGMAAAVFGQTSNPPVAFTFTIFDLLYPEDFTNGPNLYQISFSRYPAAPVGNFRLVKSEVDYFAGTTSLTVRSV